MLTLVPLPDGGKKFFTVGLRKEALLAAYLDAQDVTPSYSLPNRGGAHASNNAAAQIHFDEFCEALVRCAEASWADVEHMRRPCSLRALLSRMDGLTTDEQELSKLMTSISITYIRI